MRKTMLLGVVLGLLVSRSPVWAEEPQGNAEIQKRKGEIQAHRTQEKAENEAFRQSLKGLSPAEKMKALQAHRDTQYQESKSFHQQMHDKTLAAMKAKLAGNSKLTDAEKQELISFYEGQYQKNAAYYDQQHQENTAFFQSIANDTSLTQEQKKAAIKDHFAKQKELNKTYRQDQKSARQEMKAKIRSEVQAQKPPAGTGTK